MSLNRHQRRSLKKLDLHQVFVETRKGRVIAVGPKQSDRSACETLIAEINRHIINGTETLWSNPHIVSVPAVL